MAKRDLELALKIRAFVEGLKNITGLSQEVDKLGAKAAKPIPDPTPELRAGADRTSTSVQALGRSLTGLVSIAAIQHFVRSSVDEFAKAEAAFRGLEAVANYSGVGIGRAMQEAEKLAADGSMTVAESSKALQNLLARGYNVDQAVETLNRLKDAAAFNRAANLSMGEAVVSASEGLKNENSILVDNAGVTKNVSVMWEEYAASIGKSTSELTKQEKIEAENVGIKRETAAQLGNAAKAADGFAGQMNKADTEMKKFGASMGQILAPAVAGLATAGTWLIENVAKPMALFFYEIVIRIGMVTANLAILYDAISRLDFSRVNADRAAAMKLAEEQLEKFRKNLKNGDLDLAPMGETAKKAAGDTSAAAAEMAKAMKQTAKDRKDAVNEQIKDAEKLRDALIKAFDDSLKTETDYRAQAKKLRAEAAQPAKDSSVEGQASATLALIAAEQKLQNLKGSAPLEDVQAQAEQVRALAENLDDQARAQEAVTRSKLAEADALDRAADGEKTRQAGLNAQQKLNEERLTALQQIMKDLEAGKTVTLDADTAQASTAVEQVKALWDAIQDKTVTLTVKQAGAAATGAIPGYATGTILPGYGGGDRRLILAEDGEAITRKEAVAYYGRSFMAQLNRMQIPRFQSGGIVSSVAAASPAGFSSQPVTLNIPGMGSWPMSASPSVAEEVRAVLAREAMKRGRRH